MAVGTMPDQGSGLGLGSQSAERTIGGLLRRQREARGLSADDVKARLRIQRRYVEAMEDDRFTDLPGGAYASAYLRAYALVLERDPNKALALYGWGIALVAMSKKAEGKNEKAAGLVFDGEVADSLAKFGLN